MKNSINTRFICWLVLALLPIVGASAFAVKIIDTRLNYQVERNLDNMRRLEAARINDALGEYKKDVSILAVADSVQFYIQAMKNWRLRKTEEAAFITGFPGFSPINPRAELPLQELADTLLSNSRSTGSEIVALKLVAGDGRTLGRTESTSWVPYNPAIVFNAMKKNRTVFGNAFATSNGEQRLGIAAPVVDSNGSVAGALVAEARLGPVVDLVKVHDGIGSTSEAFIAQLTADGDVEFITSLHFNANAAFNKIIPRSENSSIIGSLQLPGSRIIRSLDYRNVDSILAMETIEPTGWGLVVKIDAEEANAPIAEIIQIVLIATVCSVIVILLGWLLVLNPLALRLRRVATAAERVASRDFKMFIGDEIDDEIGVLARNIDHLAAELDEGTAIRVTVEERLQLQESHDELTKAYNRNFANSYLRDFNSTHTDEECSVVCLDLVSFKIIIDTHGHSVGDELLVAISKRLEKNKDDRVLISRWSSDEFLVILPGVDHEEAKAIAGTIGRLFKQPFNTSAGEICPDFNMGMATADAGQSVIGALHEAESQIQSSKKQSESNRSRTMSAAGLVESAIKQNRVEVWFQPVVTYGSFKEQVVVGAEALVRIRSADKTVIPPNSFMHDIEDHPMGLMLDRVILLKSLETFAQWRAESIVDESFTMSINLTLKSLGETSLVTVIRTRLLDLGIPPERIILEVRLSQFDGVSQALAQLRSMGAVVCVDDLTLHHSSIEQLISSKPAIVKLAPQHLLPENADDNSADASHSGLYDVSTSLGMMIIAKQVADETQKDALVEQGITHFQGFYIGKPLDAQNFAGRWGNDPADDSNDNLRLVG